MGTYLGCLKSGLCKTDKRVCKMHETSNATSNDVHQLKPRMTELYYFNMDNQDPTASLWYVAYPMTCNHSSFMSPTKSLHGSLLRSSFGYYYIHKL